MAESARIAFWLNIYNALLLHELSLRPRRGHLFRHLRMFRRVSYAIGSETYSLDVIEHGMLRANRRPPTWWRPLLRSGDRGLKAAIERVDPRIHFALNCGARYCPPIRAYEADSLNEQLRLASRSYLASESNLDREARRVQLPALMKIYRTDFGDRRRQLAFASEHLGPDAAWLREEGDPVEVSYGRYDWTLIAGTSHPEAAA